MDKLWLTRTAAILGEDAIQRLEQARVVVLGLGGVGSAACEGLARSGVGSLLLVDADEVNDSNRNRQLIATVDTVGRKKAEATKERLLSINPQGNFSVLCEFLLPETLDPIFAFQPDCIIDAIDTVTTKLAVAKRCREQDLPLFMSMGTGGRLDPSLLRTGTLADTQGCGCSLARVLRRELKKQGITDIPVVYSLEPPCKTIVDARNGRHSPTSTAFVPPCAGFSLASLAVRELVKKK